MKRVFSLNLLVWVLLAGLLAAGGRADIFITDGSGTIGQYTPSLQTVNAQLISGLDFPTGIAISGTDLFVANFGSGTVSQYTTSGTLVNAALISGLDGPWGLAVSGTDLYVANYMGGTIGKYTTAGAVVDATLITGVEWPMGVAVSGSDLFVTDASRISIGRYTTSGATVDTAWIKYVDALGVTVSGSNLYVPTFIGVSKYTTSGALVNSQLIGLQISPNGTAIGVSGSNLYVAQNVAIDAADGSRISKYTTTGVLLKTAVFPQLIQPWGIAVGGPDTVLPKAPTAPMLNITPGAQVPKPYWGFNEGHGNGMVGWTFTLKTALTITQVGWYDDGQDGLSRDIQVGLWAGNSGNSPQLLGTSADGMIIPAGPGAELNGCWRVVDLPEPLNLQPGYYILGGLDTAATTDTIVYALATSKLQSDLAGARFDIGAFFYGQMDYSGKTGLHKPETFYLANGLELGPMLFTDVPEPSSLLLVGVGVLLLGVWRR